MAIENNVAVKPPVAKKVPKADTLHGDTRVDNYYWLREKSSPEVIDFLNAENAYTDSVMKPTEPLQEALYQEMVARIKETDLSVPTKNGEYWYYTRTEQGKQYQINCRKKGSLEAKEEVILDQNELAKGQKYLGLGAFTVSDDGNLLAYSTDITGFREYTLHVKNLQTGETLSDSVPKVISITWAADNKTLFYTTIDAAKRPYRLYRHSLGTTQNELVYEEKDELYTIGAYRTKDKKYIFCTSQSSDTTEDRYIAADQPQAAWKIVLPREKGHEYSTDSWGGQFFLTTNDQAKNFRVVSAPIADPVRKNWKEFIPHNPNVLIQGVDFFAGHAVVSEYENGLPKLRILDMKTNKSHRIEFPDPAYSLSAASQPEFNTTSCRFSYQSLVRPSSVFEYDMNTHERKLLKQTDVLGGFKPEAYESQRLFATAKDGAKVPVSVVYKKGLKLDGKNPLLLYAYGSYGISMPDSFSSSRLSLLDRGFVYAIAHIRGGKEMGEIWHDQGKLMNKKNTFTDFIACGEMLIEKKFTSKEKLVIEGGSAGGLLMGAVTNMRPDLFKVVVSHVPFVDVMNTMLDASLPLTVGEYLEWGNPNEKDAYFYMKSYCPYTNIEAKNYPIILVKTSLNDSQVMYWEPAKYVAKLRATKTDNNLLMLKINMAAGHGGSSGRYDALKETAFDYAFMLTQLGVVK
ncbi:MAG: S9 family peptidase [Blastocatellia bacterium]|nr:S9 family peptidase [Blastocatellia bacterium]